MTALLRVAQNWASPYDVTSLPTHFAGSSLSVCVCVHVVSPTDGTVIGVTSASSNLTSVPGYVGVTFKSTSGMSGSNVEAQQGASPTNMEADVFLVAAGITEADALAGKWSHALTTVFLTNYEALKMGQYVIAKGYLGSFVQRGQMLSTEIMGFNQALNQSYGKVTRPECTRKFCDAQCTLDAADYTVTGTLTGVTSQTEFTDSSRAEVDDTFGNGVITFTGPTVLAAATGTFERDPNASDGDFIVVNGATFTFKTSPSGAYEILINASGLTTLDNAVTKLNASTDPLVSVATYSRVGNTILITYDTVGTDGNSFTTTDSGGGVIADQATLSGGSTRNENTGYSFHVDSFTHSTHKFTLRTPTPYLPVIGDTYSAIYGCRKRASDCKTRVQTDSTPVNNIVNFDGDEWIPTLEDISRLPKF